MQQPLFSKGMIKISSHLIVSMHHAPACPSESPPGAQNKTQCDTWGMTRVEFPLRCRWTQWFIKKNEQVSRSAMARRDTWAGRGVMRGEDGWGWREEKEHRAECRAVVSIHMVSQLVGGPVVRSQWSRASPRMTAKSSHTRPERTLSEKGDANAVECVWVCAVLDRCTRCPLSTPVVIVTNILWYHGRGWRPNGRHCKPAYLGLAVETERGPGPSAWQVTQVNTSHRNNPQIFHNIWKGQTGVNCLFNAKDDLINLSE